MRARTLTGCTRRQIVTRVFFPLPPGLADRGGLRFSKLIIIYYTRPSENGGTDVKCGKIATFLKNNYFCTTSVEKSSLGRTRSKTTTVGWFFFPRIRFIRFRYIAPYIRSRRVHVVVAAAFYNETRTAPPPPPRGDRFFLSSADRNIPCRACVCVSVIVRCV